MVNILFENEDVVAIDKPEGLLSIPGRPPGEDTALAQLSAHFGVKIYVVHRLDREVSGVMLFAKNAAAHKSLNDQFSNRQTKKTYLCLTHGAMPDQKGIIDKPVRLFGSGRMGVDEHAGKPSQTAWEVIAVNENYSLIKASPLTGRRHQIRVHCYAIGHPIVGDVRYGTKTTQRAFGRLMLHARSISLTLPSEEPKTFNAPLPQSFSDILESLGFSGAALADF